MLMFHHLSVVKLATNFCFVPNLCVQEGSARSKQHKRVVSSFDETFHRAAIQQQQQTRPKMFFKWANRGLFFVYYRLFQMTQFKYKSIKAYMVCLGLAPGVGGWKAQTNPRSYCSTPFKKISRSRDRQTHKITYQRL